MRWLLYLRLFVLTAGTLLPFFWMVVVLGHRRQRNFERVFFFLCLALTCFFGSGLLALNAQLYYATPPQALLRFVWSFMCLGLWFVPPLVVHLHAEYASIRDLFQSPRERYIWLTAAWLPAFTLIPSLWGALRLEAAFGLERPAHVLGLAYQIWLTAAIVVAGVWQERFRRAAPDGEQKMFHRAMEVLLFIIALLLVQIAGSERLNAPIATAGASAIVMILVLLPFGILIGNVRRFNFLQIGRQGNLIYAVFTVFLALLYLSLVRRASQWLEPYLPPEATAALLLFLPVVFFEPLQRVMRRLLKQTAQNEMDRAQKLMGPINEAARLGDLEKLTQFAERWIGEQLQLAEVHLSLASGGSLTPMGRTRRSSSEEWLAIHRGGRHLGTLAVRSYGAMVSGETYGALELIAEQLPAAFDLCLLIEEKLRLERELAERERLALVGQMAASISHNLKNPLGSIKTILQVELESGELPASMRQETQMVLEEINRLSAKLNQLLQFSRPGTRSGAGQERCALERVAQSVVEVMRHEAESRGIHLELALPGEAIEAAASGEVANDILSNLVLNAMEAVSAGGTVRLELRPVNGNCWIVVEDDGPGIPAAMKDKILQPFFTTKARGTGLGLTIVQRRLAECGGSLEWDSPVRNGKGTRFRLSMPLATSEQPQGKRA